MATSSALSTTNQYIKYKITVTQNSQSIANNTSNVTVSVKVYRTNTGYTTYGTGTVYCKINGTKYSASVTSSDKITSSGIVLFTKTLNIAHNSDGTKTLATSAWISHSQFDSNEQSYSQALTTIPRKSSLSVGNGTLGTAQTLTVTRQSTSFTHTIVATCGVGTETLATKSTSTSISFTPPIAWASQNTTGTSVSVTYTITTYNGNTSIGSNSYTKTCSIPSSAKPSCSVAVSDAMGYASTYGGYIKGLSKFKVVVTPTTSFGSPIASYSITTNGTTYTSASFTTGVLTSHGTLTVNATVKDKRGRSGSDSESLTVLNYTAPKGSLKVGRCNTDGTVNDKGEYIKVTFSGTVTSLNSKNSATYTLQYKKTSDSSYTNVALSDYSNNYSVTNGSYIFKADTGSSYDVQLKVKDDFKTTTLVTKASTAFTLMHFSSGGTGMGIGKVAEEEGLLDIGVPVRFREGIFQNLLWSGNYYMTSEHTIALSEAISKQPSGIVLVFSEYVDGDAQNTSFICHFVPKMVVALHSGVGHLFQLATSTAHTATKYLYISDSKIVGHDNNGKQITRSDGLILTNNRFVLRYVIGV